MAAWWWGVGNQEEVRRMDENGARRHSEGDGYVHYIDSIYIPTQGWLDGYTHMCQTYKIVYLLYVNYAIIKL